VPLQYLPYLGILTLGPLIGWTWIIFIGSRDTGAEVFGEKIWWKHLRWVHVVLYASFSILAFMKNPRAWIIMLVDVLFGLMSWFIHHWKAGNFSKLWE
jgi:hypothetical protein